ncbi:hypothetical protein [Wolbachia endosymbiont (group A) of Norellia spinipes]
MTIVRVAVIPVPLYNVIPVPLYNVIPVRDTGISFYFMTVSS